MSKYYDINETSKDDVYGKKNVVVNIGWKFLERGTAVAITFLVQILLARLLSPSEFGLAAMITVFVTITTIFVSGGLSNALIQKHDADNLDFSTIFWLNIFFSILLYLTLFFLAPLISNFYGYPQLTLMLRILSLKILIYAVNSIQTAYISKKMMFKFYFYSTMTGKVASGILGVGIALLGGGVWSLIIQALSLVFFETVVLWFKAKWRPQFIFSLSRAKSLYSFAFRIMMTNLIEIIRDQTRTLLIGKIYSSQDLAYYDKAFLFPTNIITNISSSLSAVMFPVAANAKGSIEKALRICRKWLSVYAYSVLPILIGLAITAESIVIVILTEKWMQTVPYLRLVSISYIAWIFEVPIRETLKSLGHAKIILDMQIVKTIIFIIVLLFVINRGMNIVAVSAVLLSVVNILISIIIAKRVLKYDFHSLFKDIYQTVVLCLIMIIGVLMVAQIEMNHYLLLLIQVSLGGLIYLLGSILMKNSNFKFIMEMVNKIFRRR